jgi:hypothetical protein
MIAEALVQGAGYSFSRFDVDAYAARTLLHKPGAHLLDQTASNAGSSGGFIDIDLFQLCVPAEASCLRV